MKSILWICPGGVAKYPGKIGDVLAASSVTNYLFKKGYSIHFVTNAIMNSFLQESYDFSTSSLTENESLSQTDLETGKKSDFIFILKPFNDNFGNLWKKQLLDFGIKEYKICIIGKLDSFSKKGLHITQQILERVLEFLNENKTEENIFPLLKIDKLENKLDYAILPFAGDKRKWLENKTVFEIISKLNGDIGVFGTEEEIKEINDFKNEIENKFPNVKFYGKKIKDVCSSISKCKTIFCVDGGLMWSVISGLNYLTINNKITREEFPKFKVIIGKDIRENYLPSSSVWKPLAIYPEKIEIVNEKQEIKLKDITIEMILN